MSTDDLIRRLRHAADTLDEDEDNAPMFGAVMRQAATALGTQASEVALREEQLRVSRIAEANYQASSAFERKLASAAANGHDHCRRLLACPATGATYPDAFT